MPAESIAVPSAAGRWLAEPITADRDYPPFPRSARDGFAVRAADLPGSLEIIGEVRAGERFPGAIQKSQAVEIMTGAPLPDGADAVVMIEHVRREGDRVHIGRPAKSGDNFNPRGVEAKQGEVILSPGHKLDYASIALLISVGRSSVRVHKQPRVAIIATGDEIVELDQTPLDFQIRNSNSFSLAAQVERAGGVPNILPIARDNAESTRAAVAEGVKSDLLLLSGGVSAGKYDIVEPVLAEFGAEFFFDRVLIQPGAPLVFGRAQDKFFFGLPGNPGSTMITFEVFARLAIEKMQGCPEPHVPLLRARLTEPFRQKTGLTRFLPARLSADGITPMKAHGSGDVVALANASAYLVTEPDREEWAAGDDIRVLVK